MKPRLKCDIALSGFGKGRVCTFVIDAKDAYRWQPPPKNADLLHQPPSRITLPTIAWDATQGGRIDIRSLIGPHGPFCHTVMCPLTGGLKAVSTLMVTLSWYMSSPASSHSAGAGGGAAAMRAKNRSSAVSFARFCKHINDDGAASMLPKGAAIVPRAMFDPPRMKRKGKLGLAPTDVVVCSSIHHDSALTSSRPSPYVPVSTLRLQNLKAKRKALAMPAFRTAAPGGNYPPPSACVHKRLTLTIFLNQPHL